MKHKYVFSKDNDTGHLIIREYAELSKENFSTVCESRCEIKQIEEAVAGGVEAVMVKMRNQNFFPPSNFLEKIAHSVTELITSGDQSTVEVYCDDTEFLTKSLNKQETYGKIEEEADDSSGNFIGDDLPDDFDDEVKPNVSGGTINIEDDALEAEDD